MPPSLFGYANNVTKYPYNPAKAKALLKQAGLKLPVKIDFWYPTGVSRPYMPDPQRNFQAFSASLDEVRASRSCRTRAVAARTTSAASRRARPATSTCRVDG